MPRRAPSRPPVRHNDTLTYEDLHAEAVKAFEAWGGSQSALAKRIKRHRSSVLRALENVGSTYAAVQREIITELTGFRVSEEPEFRVKRKAE